MSKVINVLIFIVAVVDIFFITYAVGLNIRHVDVEDESLRPPSAPVAVNVAPPATTAIAPPVATTVAPPSTVSATSASSSSFSDLTQTDKRLQPSLIKAADAGILDPTKDQQFRPNDPVTRADFTRWMVRTRQVEPVKSDTASYTDVDSANPYYADIEGATKQGYVQGYTVKGSAAKDFKPDQNITRQELAVMYGTFSGKRGRAEKLTKEEIEQYLRYNPSASEFQLVTFKDVGDVDDWARKWVAVANQAGVLEQCFDVNPYSTTEDKRYFHPHKMMTRAEAVNILVKLYGADSRKAVQDSATSSTTSPSGTSAATATSTTSTEPSGTTTTAPAPATSTSAPTAPAP